MNGKYADEVSHSDMIMNLVRVWKLLILVYAKGMNVKSGHLRHKEWSGKKENMNIFHVMNFI
jgi:hypothetical protein